MPLFATWLPRPGGARARDILPEIRGLAEETERNRTISPEIIPKIRNAELLRITRPREFGGFEYDPVVALEIALVVSAACASTGWAVNGTLSNGISFGHFPIETQRELWGGGAGPSTCACFAPTGTAVPIVDMQELSGSPDIDLVHALHTLPQIREFIQLAEQPIGCCLFASRGKTGSSHSTTSIHGSLDRHTGRRS